MTRLTPLVFRRSLFLIAGLLSVGGLTLAGGLWLKKNPLDPNPNPNALSTVLKGEAPLQTFEKQTNSPSTPLWFHRHNAPRPLPYTLTFSESRGTEKSLHDFRGRWVLINFWAPWCQPCRMEMPSLHRLQQHIPTSQMEILAVNVAPGQVDDAERFLQESGSSGLSLVHFKGDFASLGLPGLPTSLLISPNGQEVGRVIGPSEHWDSPSTLAFFHSFLK